MSCRTGLCGGGTCAECRVDAAVREAAACRRAYLHERWRADEACSELAKYDRAAADTLMAKSYTGYVLSVGDPSDEPK